MGLRMKNFSILGFHWKIQLLGEVAILVAIWLDLFQPIESLGFSKGLFLQICPKLAKLGKLDQHRNLKH